MDLNFTQIYDRSKRNNLNKDHLTHSSSLKHNSRMAKRDTGK